MFTLLRNDLIVINLIDPMFTPYHPTQDDKNASACYDMLDNSPIDAVIAKFGLRQTLRSLAHSLTFHAEDNDEPLLQEEEKWLAGKVVEALGSVQELEVPDVL